MARWLTVRLRFDSQQKERHFSSSKHPDSPWTSENFLVIECKGSFPRIKRPKPDTSHSSLSRSEIKNTWWYNSTPPYVFKARYLFWNRVIFSCRQFCSD